MRIVVPENAQFCPECGKRLITATTKIKTIETVQFRCKGCGNVMEINPESPVLRCSFCGSNELIQEDKDITVERIRSRSKREGQQTYKEVQKGWQAIRPDYWYTSYINYRPWNCFPLQSDDYNNHCYIADYSGVRVYSDGLTDD